ncbi:MAG: Nif11-like leader peptide family natural product precursor [Cyanobacteria bacterium J06638_7]
MAISDYQEFLKAVKADRELRTKLRVQKQIATSTVAKESGFNVAPEDVVGPKKMNAED